MDIPQPRFFALVAKTMVSYTLTYFIIGVLAAHFLNYAALMARPESGMRQITSPWVMAGPLFQPLRGLVFALVFYPLIGSAQNREKYLTLQSLFRVTPKREVGPFSSTSIHHGSH